MASSLAPVVLEYEARSLLEGLGGRDAVLTRARLKDSLHGRALGAARALLGMSGESPKKVANALWPSNDTSATRSVSLIVEAARASGRPPSTPSMPAAMPSTTPPTTADTSLITAPPVEALSPRGDAAAASPAGKGTAYRVAFDFTAEAENELSVCAGDVVFVAAADVTAGADWVHVYTTEGAGAEGFVPAAFLIAPEPRPGEDSAVAADVSSPLAARLNNEDLSRMAIMAFSFEAAGPGEISILQGTPVEVLPTVGLNVAAGWVRVKRLGGTEVDAVGFVPESFLRDSSSPPLPLIAFSPPPPQKALAPPPPPPPPNFIMPPPPSNVLALVSEASSGFVAGPSRTCLEFKFSSAATPADVSSFSAGFLTALARVGIEARVALREAESAIAASTSASHSVSATQIGAALNMARVAGPAGIAAAASVLRMHAAIVSDLETQAANALELALKGRPLDGEFEKGKPDVKQAAATATAFAGNFAALHVKHDHAAHDAAHAAMLRLATRTLHNEAAHAAANAATSRLAAHAAAIAPTSRIAMPSAPDEAARNVATADPSVRDAGSAAMSAIVMPSACGEAALVAASAATASLSAHDAGSDAMSAIVMLPAHDEVARDAETAAAVDLAAHDAGSAAMSAIVMLPAHDEVARDAATAAAADLAAHDVHDRTARDAAAEEATRFDSDSTTHFAEAEPSAGSDAAPVSRSTSRRAPPPPPALSD